jgi:hypothetical protein
MSQPTLLFLFDMGGFPCGSTTVLTKAHQLTTTGLSTLTITGPAQITITPLGKESPPAVNKLTLPQLDGSAIKYTRDRDNNWSSQIVSNVITVSQSNGIRVYERDADGIWCDKDGAPSTYRSIFNKRGEIDKAYLPKKEEDQHSFLKEYNKLDYISPFHGTVNIHSSLTEEKVEHKQPPSTELNTTLIGKRGDITISSVAEVVSPPTELNNILIGKRGDNICIGVTEFKVTQIVYKAFVLGRKAQYISDYHPVLAKDKGRARKMSKLLPSLIATKPELDKNLQLSFSATNCYPNLNEGYIHNINHLNQIEQWKLGRDYQMLRNSNFIKYDIDLLTPVQMAEEAASFREKLNNGYFNLRKNRDKFQKRLENVDIIDSCYGNKCRIDFSDGNDEHCESCSGPLTIEQIAAHLHSNCHNNQYYGEYSELEKIIREY